MTEADKMLLEAETAKETKKALEAGADVEARDWEFCTALMKSKTAEQTRLLIEAGADVNAEEYRYTGVRPLMLAATAEQTRLLIKAGADVNARNFGGYTALQQLDKLDC